MAVFKTIGRAVTNGTACMLWIWMSYSVMKEQHIRAPAQLTGAFLLYIM